VEYRPGDVLLVYDADAQHADLARPVDDLVVRYAKAVETAIWRYVDGLALDLAVLGFVPCCSWKTWPCVRAAAVPVLAAMTLQRKAATVFAGMLTSVRFVPSPTI
jgi:hypothetical protein